MNTITYWMVKRSALAFVNKILALRKDQIMSALVMVTVAIEKIERVIAFLRSLKAKLEDMKITDQEAEEITQEAKQLANDLRNRGVVVGGRPYAAACALLLSVACLAGCSTGMSVTLKDSTGVNVGNITLEGSTIPVVSYFSGPTFTAWFNKDYAPTVVIDGKASLTNATSALGIYNSAESKSLSISLASTNAPAASAKID